MSWKRVLNVLLCFKHLGYHEALLCSPICSYIFSRSDDIETLIKGFMAVSQCDVTPPCFCSVGGFELKLLQMKITEVHAIQIFS